MIFFHHLQKEKKKNLITIKNLPVILKSIYFGEEANLSNTFVTKTTSESEAGLFSFDN